jgi:hypothetical protein
MSQHIRLGASATVRVAIAAIAALAFGAAGAPAGSALAASAAPALPSGCSQSGATVTCTYTAQGEHQFAVPSGVTSVTATAVGGEGMDPRGINGGGLGAVATGTIAVTPGQVLFAEVGILGGAAGVGLHDGGVGGGESDVRTCPANANGQPCPAGPTLDSRLLVAAGGGGRGFGGLQPGNAGTPSPGGNGALFPVCGVLSASGGEGATSTVPGAQGIGCGGGIHGFPGLPGAGGAGGDGSSSQVGQGGGGGGAGWLGGGGGGGGGSGGPQSTAAPAAAGQVSRPRR